MLKPDEAAYLLLKKMQRHVDENDVSGFEYYHEEITKLVAKQYALAEQLRHLLWFIEVEQKLDGGHITQTARNTLMDQGLNGP